VNGRRLRHLRRIQWWVRAALTLGVAASVAANVMHARPDLAARVISAWAPVALLVVIELISRVPVHRTWLAVVRHAAAALVAAVAAWASYWHMAAVAARHGEETVTAHVLPVSVDMLIVVASICLVEIGGQIRAAAGDDEDEPDVPAVPFDVPTAVTAPPIAAAVDVDSEPAEVASAVTADPPTSVQKIVARRRRRSSKPARGTGRTEVARAYAQIPADDGRSKKEIAADIASETGLSAATVRTYLGELHGPAAEVAESNGAAVTS